MSSQKASAIKGAKSRRRVIDARYQRLERAVWQLMYAARNALPTLQGSANGRAHANRLQAGLAALDAFIPTPEGPDA